MKQHIIFLGRGIFPTLVTVLQNGCANNSLNNSSFRSISFRT